ncbi:hypothetical protein Mro02_41760 [Microbispora rosea subsp. aerata]|nr:hypothetical protein Mro02_41760 [Microbispora rosea subsp. aerata]GLJ83403.1 hypothetical protein GCM10017588_21310 [Microbispora rosea subsp. aerata]
MAAAVLAAEGLLALVMGGYVGVETVIGKPTDLVTSIAVAGFGVLGGALLFWVAWGLWQVLRWSRGPAVVTQIFALPVALSLIQSAQYAFGVPLIAAAAVGLVTLLAPASTHALMGEDGTPGES